MGRRSEAAASGVLRRKAQFSSAERHRAPRLKREIYRFNDELKRKYFPRRADRDRGARFFFGDGPVAGGAATKLRPPRGAAEGRAIYDRGFRAAVRSVGGWRRPPASSGRHCAEKGVRAELGTEPVATRRVAVLCGAAGHSNRGFAEPQGGGQGRVFSEKGLQPVDKLNNCDSSSRASHRHPGRGAQLVGARCVPRWRRPVRGLGQVRTVPAGVSQGGRRPLGCVLCLLSVASQKVGAPAARAGERKEIDSPREGWGSTGDWEASSWGGTSSPYSWRQRN